MVTRDIVCAQFASRSYSTRVVLRAVRKIATLQRFSTSRKHSKRNMIANPKRICLLEERRETLKFMEWCLFQAEHPYNDSELWKGVRDNLLAVARMMGEKSRRLEQEIRRLPELVEEGESEQKYIILANIILHERTATQKES